MKRTITLLSFSLISFSSFSQVKKSETVNLYPTKSDTTKQKPVANNNSQLAVSLTIAEWGTIITALGEMPQKISNPIIQTINTYFIYFYQNPPNK